ncbi:MAG: DUF2442 domain-containing protein [Chloroflexota bacterium]
MEHVAALIRAIFENALDYLDKHAQAQVFVTPLSADETVISLEVSRDRRDWQRNLVLAITESPDSYEISAKITDDEQVPIADIGTASVAIGELADVSMSLARAGIARLRRELDLDRQDGNTRHAIVSSARVNDALITLVLADGREISAPTSWSRRLASASEEERERYDISPDGLIVAWPDIDEHIGVWSFLGFGEEDLRNAT